VIGTDEFIAANLIAVFYHEFGHALIDILEIPIYGQEEDAADVLSVLMIDELFEEQSAVDIAASAAFGLRGDTDLRAAIDREVYWWDVHGADLQRYYTHVCLFYGADPSERRYVAKELGLPDARAQTCREEWEQANRSWGRVLRELYARGAGDSIRFRVDGRIGRDDFLTVAVIREEVKHLNARLSLPVPLQVDVEQCGEANAFYVPADREIIMCTEFADYLWEIAP
jgi:hypothetical protein